LVSTEPDAVTDESARRLANALVQLFTSPLKVMGTRGAESPVTIADAIRLGGLFIAAFNVATGDPVLKEKTRVFAEKIVEFIFQPEAMEEFLFNRIKTRLESEQEILESIALVEAQLAGPGAFRRFVKKAFAEAMPKARQGRPTQFNPESDPDRFLSESARLAKTCGQFLDLKEGYPNRSTKELLAFLESDDPKGIGILRKHERQIDQTLNDLDFRILKSPKSRTTRLADSISGKELFGWSPTYAIQRGGELRRSKETASEE
jgi:hypothetical protein